MPSAKVVRRTRSLVFMSGRAGGRRARRGHGERRVEDARASADRGGERHVSAASEVIATSRRTIVTYNRYTRRYSARALQPNE